MEEKKKRLTTILYRFYLTALSILAIILVATIINRIKDYNNEGERINAVKLHLKSYPLTSEILEKQKRGNSSFTDEEMRSMVTRECLEKLVEVGGTLSTCERENFFSPDLYLLTKQIDNYDYIGHKSMISDGIWIFLCLTLLLIIFRFWLYWMSTGKLLRKFP